MRAVTKVKKRAAILAMAAVVALGATACFPDTGPPPEDALQRGIFDAMNYDRAVHGLPPFTWSPRAASNAGPHSADMAAANRLYHSNLSALLYSPDYANFWTLAENILVGYNGMSIAQMEQAWMNSPGHRANILSPNFNVAGSGFWYGADGRIYATVIFGGI